MFLRRATLAKLFGSSLSRMIGECGLAIRVSGASPELPAGLCSDACGAQLHWFAAVGADGCVGLVGRVGQCAFASAVEFLGEAAVLEEFCTLAVDLAFQKIDGLVDCAEHCVAGQLWLCSFHKV